MLLRPRSQSSGRHTNVAVDEDWNARELVLEKPRQPIAKWLAMHLCNCGWLALAASAPQRKARLKCQKC